MITQIFGILIPISCYFLGILAGRFLIDDDLHSLEILKREKTISDLRFDNSMLQEEIATLKQHLSGK